MIFQITFYTHLTQFILTKIELTVFYMQMMLFFYLIHKKGYSPN